MIESKSPKKLWRFYVYRSPNGSLPVEDWYWEDISERAQFAIQAALKDAQKIGSHHDWGCWKRFLRGKDFQKHRIWELEFSCGDNVQYRLAGIFGPEQKQAIFLIGFYHKGNTYTPANALRTAVLRAKQIREKTATFHERTIAICR